MAFSEAWKYLQNVHRSILVDSPERQDEVCNALFLFLYGHQHQQYPSLLYASAIWLLDWYLDTGLPALDYYAEEDRQGIISDYTRLKTQLEESLAISEQIECAIERLLERIRTRTDLQVEQVAEAFLEIAQSFFGIHAPETESSADELQRYLDTLRQDFGYEQAAAFFKPVFETLLGDAASAVTSDARLGLYNFRQLFTDTLERYFQSKAILVTRFEHGHVLPVRVMVDSDQQSEHVEFWNQDVNALMQQSADVARRAARAYLYDECGRLVSENLLVQCQFPGHAVSFKDASASLLIGIRIVGEVLGLKCRPATLVTGEVGRSGEILQVGYINEKLTAARRHEGIERIIIPEANIPGIHFPQEAGAAVIPVRTFTEAVHQTLELHREDWGEAPGLDVLYGRQEELAMLQQWILDEECRLVTILGMGGIGKTTLTRHLADQIRRRFDYVFWRDLRNAPPVENVLNECIKFLSDQQYAALPGDVYGQLSLLIRYLNTRRCLIVLDNMETLLQGSEGGRTGVFRQGYTGYGDLLDRAGRTDHRSCLIVTSREVPQQSELLAGRAVRTFVLQGLEQRDAGNFLTELRGDTKQRHLLIDRCGGHPLALKLVEPKIQDQFDGQIGAFLETDPTFTDDIAILLEQQYTGLLKGEKEVLYWLAIAREAVPTGILRADIVSPALRRKLPEALEALRRKSLIEKTAAGFTLQPVVMEYITAKVIEQVCQELSTGKVALLNSHALMKAQGKEYIRGSQQRLILKPVVENMEYEYETGRQELEIRISHLLAALRENPPSRPGYAAGNLLNVLLYIDPERCGDDFSSLPIWQAYLQGSELREVNLAHADLQGSVFTDTFGNILSVAYSPDGAYLAAGTLSKEVRIWETSNYQQQHTCAGHTGWVWSVAFHPDGTLLASGSHDHTVKLWDVATGECRVTLREHTSWVVSVAFSPDGRLLISRGIDGVRIWDVRTGHALFTFHDPPQGFYAMALNPAGTVLAVSRVDHTIQLWAVPTQEALCPDNVASLQLLAVLEGHTGRVRSLAFNAGGDMLVSGGEDRIIRIWDIGSRQCVSTLTGHTDVVKSLVFSSGGQQLASGSNDQTIRLWDVSTGHCLKTLQGHRDWVWSVAFQPGKHVLASGASDQSIRIWDTEGGHCVRTIEGYTNRTLSLAFHPEKPQFVTGHSNKDIHLWEIQDGRWCCCFIFQGHTNWVMSVAFNPDGAMIASGSSDATVRVWDVRSGECLKHFEKPGGHSGMVRSVAFAPDGKTLVSCSDDDAIRLWEISSGRCVSILNEPGRVFSAAFHPDGRLLASGNRDYGVRVWKIDTEECLYCLSGHTASVRSVNFSPNGTLLASGSEDQTLRFWDVTTGKCVNVLEGHTKPVRSVTFSPNGTLLASGSEDQTVRLWEAETGACRMTLTCHEHQTEKSDWIRALAFSHDGQMLLSGGEDGTIRFWDTHTGELLDTLHPDRPYERMNITGISGITEAQKATLKALGAVEDGSV